MFENKEDPRVTESPAPDTDDPRWHELYERVRRVEGEGSMTTFACQGSSGLAGQKVLQDATWGSGSCGTNQQSAQGGDIGNYQSGQQHVCPACGYCPCCGRRSYTSWNPPWPNYPQPYIGDLPNWYTGVSIIYSTTSAANYN